MVARQSALELDPGLLAHPRQRPGAGALERRLERQRQAAELRQRVDAAGGQLPPLAGGDAGDEAEVVVGPPAGRALGCPAADVAVLDGFGYVAAGGYVGGSSAAIVARNRALTLR